eukprot:scaffold2835_cov105-Isochrysis_galbana.AAC.9
MRLAPLTVGWVEHDVVLDVQEGRDGRGVRSPVDGHAGVAAGDDVAHHCVGMPDFKAGLEMAGGRVRQWEMMGEGVSWREMV